MTRKGFWDVVIFLWQMGLLTPPGLWHLSQKSGVFFKASLTPSPKTLCDINFLDALANVCKCLSVGGLVSLLMMEFLTDEHSVRSTLDGISLCNNTILVSVADWPIDVSFSLANWNKLTEIGWLKSAAHGPIEIRCSLANWNQLLICQH